MNKNLTLIFLASWAFSCREPFPISVEHFNNPQISVQDMEVHDLVLSYKKKLNTVGFSLGIYAGGTTSFYGYGEAKKGSGLVPDAYTVYEIGSITKVFTALLAKKYLDENGYTTDREIYHDLPDDVKIPLYHRREIRYWHILTHSSGLPYFPDNLGLKFLTNPESVFKEYSDNKMYDFLSKAYLPYEPGTRFGYSNAGMSLAGLLVEHAWGISYEQLLVSEICEPLEMSDTRPYNTPSMDARKAKGYKGGKPMPYWDDLNALNSAGVLKSTVFDLMKFGRVNLDPPSNGLGEAIRSTQVPQFSDTKNLGDDTQVGLGWFITKFRDDLPGTLYHSGGTGGFNSHLVVIPSKQLVIALCFNSIDERNLDENESRADFLTDLTELLIP